MWRKRRMWCHPKRGKISQSLLHWGHLHQGLKRMYKWRKKQRPKNFNEQGLIQGVDYSYEITPEMLEAAKTWYNPLCDEDQCDDFDAEEVLYHLHSPYPVYRYGTLCMLINWERMETKTLLLPFLFSTLWITFMWHTGYCGKTMYTDILYPNKSRYIFFRWSWEIQDGWNSLAV